jgi:hypothetical protein
MPHSFSFNNALKEKANSLISAMGMSLVASPAGCALSIEAQPKLTRDAKKLDRSRLSHLPKNLRDKVRLSDSDHRVIADASRIVIAQRVTPWGCIDVQPMAVAYDRGRFVEYVTLRFHLNALASEPESISIPNLFSEIWSLDHAFTKAVQKLVRDHRGPKQWSVQTGGGHLDTVVVHVGGTAGVTDWRAAGEALCQLFEAQFGEWVVKAIDRECNMRRTARRQQSECRGCVERRPS